MDAISVFPYTSQETLLRLSNVMTYLREKLANILPSIFGFDLTELDDDLIEIEEYDNLCSDIKKMKTHNIPIFIVNILKVGDNDAYIEHKGVIKQISPMIGSRMFSIGTPEAEYWDEISIVKYQTRTKLCEMLISKEYQDDFPNSIKGIQDARMYSTVQII